MSAGGAKFDVGARVIRRHSKIYHFMHEMTSRRVTVLLTAQARACDHSRFIRAVMPGAVLYADWTAFKIRHAER